MGRAVRARASTLLVSYLPLAPTPRPEIAVLAARTKRSKVAVARGAAHASANLRAVRASSRYLPESLWVTEASASTNGEQRAKMQASDKAFNGTTVQKVDGRGNRATCVQTKGGINPNLEEGESDYDDEGPSPCMVCANFADHGADRQAIAFEGGATCENAVGRRIVRTTMEAFRNGAGGRRETAAGRHPVRRVAPRGRRLHPPSAVRTTRRPRHDVHCGTTTTAASLSARCRAPAPRPGVRGRRRRRRRRRAKDPAAAATSRRRPRNSRVPPGPRRPPPPPCHRASRPRRGVRDLTGPPGGGSATLPEDNNATYRVWRARHAGRSVGSAPLGIVAGSPRLLFPMGRPMAGLHGPAIVARISLVVA